MNIQEYIDNEIEKGNTDITIPEGLETVKTITFKAGIKVTFPWTEFNYVGFGPQPTLAKRIADQKELK